MIENGGWTRRAGSCCLSHLDEVWHDSLVVAVESRKGGSCELSWIHLAKLLSKVLSPWSWSVKTLAFHPQRRNGFPDLKRARFSSLALQVEGRSVFQVRIKVLFDYTPLLTLERILVIRFNFGRL